MQDMLETTERIRRILRRDLKLGDDRSLPDDMPLFGCETDLDSLDALLLVTRLEAEFGIKILSEDVNETVLADIRSLEQFVNERRGVKGESIPSAESKSLSGSKVLERLPHRDPFVFVSEITSFQPGVSATGAWRVKGTEPFLQGHFPGHPIVPGVLIVEALTQISGLVVVDGDASMPETDRRLAHFDIRFKRLVEPPCELQLYTRCCRGTHRLFQFHTEARICEKIAAVGTLEIAICV